MFFKKIKGEQLVAPAVFLITALRVYSSIPVEKIFVAVFERAITDAPRFWAVIGLTIIFSLFLSLFTIRVLKENKNLAPLLIIFVADPVFLSSQDNISVLLLSSLFIICAYILLRVKNLLADSVVFVVFAFLSALFIPETIYSTIPVLFAVVLVKYFGSFYLQKIKAVVFILLSATAVISAYVLNDKYTRELFLANKFINAKTAYFYKPSLVLLVFSLLLLAGCMLLIYKAFIFAKSKTKKKKHEEIDDDSVSSIIFAGILIIACFSLQVFARVTDLVPPSHTAINICAPVIIIFLFMRYKNSLNSVLENIYTFWNNHFGICFICIAFFAFVYFKLSKDCFTATNILQYATLYLT